MDNAISVIYYIFNKVLNLLFNDVVISQGASLGWIIFVVIMFSIIFNSILNIPTGLFNGIKTRSDDREGN